MRARAAGAIAVSAMAAACTLGVIDLPPGPAPAELLVVTELSPDPADPARTQVLVVATLDPGVGLGGTPRRFVSDRFGVQGTDHLPTESGAPPLLTWTATETYPAPGPQAVPLRLPRLEGLGFASNVNMRVRVDVTPGGIIELADGEDLVLTAEPPSNPAETLEWSLELTSRSSPAFRLETGGDVSWPAAVRIPAADIPAGVLPLEATLRIRWDRSLTLFELTPEERYDLALRSIMVVDWTVEPTS